jgi:hypothetical protein
MVDGCGGEAAVPLAARTSPALLVSSVTRWPLTYTAPPPTAQALTTPSTARKSLGGAHATRVHAFHADAVRSGLLELRRTSPYQPTGVPPIALAAHCGDPAPLQRWHDVPLRTAIPKVIPQMCPTEPSQLLLTCRSTFQCVPNLPASRAGTAMNTVWRQSIRNVTHLSAPEAGPSRARTSR